MNFAKQDGTTSVKVHHAPGGASSFSLAWDQEPKKVEKKVNQNQPVQNQQPAGKVEQKTNNEVEEKKEVKTSVKVHNPPGGKSSITFG